MAAPRKQRQTLNEACSCSWEICLLRSKNVNDNQALGAPNRVVLSTGHQLWLLESGPPRMVFAAWAMGGAEVTGNCKKQEMVSVECRIYIKFRLWVTVTEKIEGWFFNSSTCFPLIWSREILGNAGCAFGIEENISYSAQVIAFMGVIWNHQKATDFVLLWISLNFLKGVRKYLTCHH